MILVLLGTQDKSFARLLSVIEKQIDDKNIKEEVIVQAGHTKFSSSHMRIYDFISKVELEEYISKASLIITHGGVGSILDSLARKKVVIAAPRLKKFGEHTNDHQLQIIDSFSKKGYIIPLYDFNKLDEALKQAKNFMPKQYKSNNKNFVNLLDNVLKKMI